MVIGYQNRNSLFSSNLRTWKMSRGTQRANVLSDMLLSNQPRRRLTAAADFRR